MYTGKYKIADCVFEIRSIYGEVHELCRGYEAEVDAEVALTVETSRQDIEYEQKKSEAEDAREGLETAIYPAPYLETLAVYRKIATHIPKMERMLFHGSAVSVDGSAYIFTAKSGTGKSTHTALWRKLFGERAVMVNDDKPIIRVDGEGARVYGTPWNGKHRLGENISAPIKGICILRCGEENVIHQIEGRQALATLLGQTFRPADPVALQKTLGSLTRLVSRVKCYELCCNMDIEAARVAYSGMNA